MKKRLLFCLLALWSALGVANQAFAQAQWNANLLQNTIPTNSSKFTGWQKYDGGSGWNIDNGWFVSSYQECILKQTVTLADKGFTAADITGAQLYASVVYEIPWSGYNSGICIASVVCLDSTGTELDTLYLLNMTGYTKEEILPTGKDSTFALPAGTAQLRYEVHGKDQKSWGGQYGPRFSGMVMMLTNGSDFSYTASVDPAIGDSITLSKTSGIHIGDTISVVANYPKYSILYLMVNGNWRFYENKVVCRGQDMVIGAHLSHPHRITVNAPSNVTITPSKASAFLNDTITLTHTLNQDCLFLNYTTSIEVTWIDSNRFIMPDADVEIGMDLITAKNVPFFEGFENGNKQDNSVYGWYQQGESGSDVWIANSTNTSYNCTPYDGQWNARLRYDNNRWLFNMIQLEAGVEYRISMYARQDITSGATVSAYLGNTADKDSMTLNILSETEVTNGDYQYIAATFSVPESNTYTLGILGKLNVAPFYLSIDNISIIENKLYNMRFTTSSGTITANKASALAGDTIMLTRSMNAGYFFVRYTTSTKVQWLGSDSFIMPAEDVEIGMEAVIVNTIPFFEGFENGNTPDSAITGWIQQSEKGSYQWVADVTPFTGTYCAYLRYNQTRWLFTPIRLEAGVEYRFSMYAMQDYTSQVTIAAYLGNVADKDSMTLNILSQTEVTNGDYQLLTAVFSVAESKDYVLGIRGEIGYTPNYVLMDNISITRNQPGEIHITQPKMGTITADKTNAIVGDTVTLSYTMPNIIDEGSYTTDIDVVWVDDNRFIMPYTDITVALNINLDSLITRTPFFDGFEEGNTQNNTVSGWNQYSEAGNSEWIANQGSDHNTAPFQGAWNAMLRYGNTDWLFRWVYLEAGKTYRLSMYARQDGNNPNDAAIGAHIGSTQDRNAMQTVIIPETGLTNGDYQLLADTFSVAESNIYALGIRGTINSNPWYMSLDNISLGEYITHTISTTDSEYSTLTVDKTEAYAGDTVHVTATTNEGCFLDSVRTNVSVVWTDDTHFIMPDADVVLTAYTRTVKTGVLHIINNTSKASLHILRNGVELANHSMVTEGDILCMVPVPAPGYKLYTVSGDTICNNVASDSFVNDTLLIDATYYIGMLQWFGPTPRVECPDSTTAVVIWDSVGCEYDVLITDVEVTDFTFQKGIRHTADTAYTMQGLTPGKTYYAYLLADKEGEEEIWNSTEFVMLPTEAGESCTLIIDCYDSYGDGWSGNTLLVEENGQITRFTFELGDSENFTYVTQGGRIAIYWTKGRYPDEASFKITTADGTVLAEVNDCRTLKDGEQLFYGNPCNICARPVITDFSRKGSDITVAWANTGAASFNVALLNKRTATEEELTALQVSTTDTAYTFHNVDTCKFYAAYVQAQCDVNSASAWVSDFYMAQPASTLQWEPITLNFHATGDAIADGKAYPGVADFPCLLYKLSLTEAQAIYGSARTGNDPAETVIAPIVNDTIDIMQGKMLADNIVQLAAGEYGIVAVVEPEEEYEVWVFKADSMRFAPITLPYLSDTLVNEYVAKDNSGSGMGSGFFRGFEFTLDKPTTLEMSLKDLAENTEAYVALWRYENGQDIPISGFVRKVQPLDSGTYHIGVFTDEEHTSYRLSVTDVLPTFAFDTIVADTVLTGTISATDEIYPYLGTSMPGKAYTFTLEEQQYMNMLFYATQSDSMAVVFFNDSILTDLEIGRLSVGMNDSAFYDDYLQNSNDSVQRYYMVVYNFTGQEQQFACALHTCFRADSVPASDTVRVNELKTVAFDAYSKGVYETYNSFAYEAYTIHLEKDKYYRLYAEAPETAGYMGIYVLDPDKKEGYLSDNSIASTTMVTDYCNAMTTVGGQEEKDYTLALTAYAPLKLHDEPEYLMAVEEMQPFDSLYLNAKEVVLPFSQDTAFGEVKYDGSNQWNWYPKQDYISSYGIYGAAAYVVRVNAGDTLYASLRTDYDAAIHFFNFNAATSATENNPVVIDSYAGYPQLAEKGMYVNTSDSVETIVVVASDNNYRPGNSRYHLILSRSLSDIDIEKIAFAEASKNAVYCEQEISIVRDALSRLTLTAKDEKGLVITTVDNIALYWDIDITAGVATYEVNDADLPAGYTFGDKASIKVLLGTQEIVFPMVDQNSISLTENTEAAAREALGKLVLTAVDADGKTVHTFVNVAADWAIDLTAGFATYTLRSEDLPEQYLFENAAETINVQLLINTAVDNVKSENTLFVYPNPATDYTFVEGATDEIRVYDVMGRLVLTVSISEEKTMLNISSLPAGMYKIYSAGKVASLIVK